MMQQWVDLARLTGLQSTEDEGPPPSPIEGQESKIEGSLEANLSSTWEQPSSPLESTDGVEVKQEVETTSAP